MRNGLDRFLQEEENNECLKKKHNCPEWDYLEICEDDPEFEACLCFRGEED